MLPNTLIVVAAKIRNHLIGQILEDAKDTRCDDSANDETLSLIAYVNNLSNEDLLVTAFDSCVDLNELSDNLFYSVREQWESIIDLPF